MFEDVHDLYQELILDHNAHPHNFGKLELASHKAHGFNPACGDDIEIFLCVEENRIKDVRFVGQGCAISKSSASIMTDELKNKTLNEVQSLFEHFHALLTNEDTSSVDTNRLGKASVFSGVKQFPIRVKCATLAWHTMRAALAGVPDPVTTE